MQQYASAPDRLEKIERSFPNWLHYDPEHYLNELEVFWYRRWIYVCRSEDVASPRDYQSVAIGDQNVIVTRDLKGQLKAFHNTCRHRGSILCTEEQGRFEGGSIVCPYHAWTYSLEGDLIATPHQLESADFDMKGYSLYNVAIGEWGGFVFVNLAGGEAEPLEGALGSNPSKFANYRMHELRVGHRETMEVEANWKIMVENFAECFHCPQVHPELNRVVPLHGQGLLWPSQHPDWEPDLTEDTSKRLELSPGMMTFTLDGSTGGRPLLSHLNEDEKNNPYQAGGVRLGLTLNIHPDYVNTFKMTPIGPTRTRMTYEWLFEPETIARPDFDLKQAYELWLITAQQDSNNCEWQQRGLMSGVHERSVFVAQEPGCLAFNQWIVEELETAGYPVG